ncbi:MAG: N-acetyltransferase [Rhodobacter sp.]|nr:N-acetyltransferase [Rhodobacter sp.]
MIRQARAGDAIAILSIWNPIIRDTAITFTSAEKTEAEVVAMIDTRAAVLVWDAGAEVQGFATYAQFRGGPGYARSQEHTILLGAGARGQGLGRALMTALEDHARAAGHHMLIGGVSGSNPAGVAFHAAIGYAQVGLVPEAGWKFGRYHDLVLMQKIL